MHFLERGMIVDFLDEKTSCTFPRRLHAVGFLDKAGPRPSIPVGRSTDATGYWRARHQGRFFGIGIGLRRFFLVCIPAGEYTPRGIACQ